MVHCFQICTWHVKGTCIYSENGGGWEILLFLSVNTNLPQLRSPKMTPNRDNCILMTGLISSMTIQNYHTGKVASPVRSNRSIFSALSGKVNGKEGYVTNHFKTEIKATLKYLLTTRRLKEPKRRIRFFSYKPRGNDLAKIQ